MKSLSYASEQVKTIQNLYFCKFLEISLASKVVCFNDKLFKLKRDENWEYFVGTSMILISKETF